jgi:hypothetical protein
MLGYWNSSAHASRKCHRHYLEQRGMIAYQLAAGFLFVLPPGVKPRQISDCRRVFRPGCRAWCWRRCFLKMTVLCGLCIRWEKLVAGRAVTRNFPDFENVGPAQRGFMADSFFLLSIFFNPVIAGYYRCGAGLAGAHPAGGQSWAIFFPAPPKRAQPARCPKSSKRLPAPGAALCFVPCWCWRSSGRDSVLGGLCTIGAKQSSM